MPVYRYKAATNGGVDAAVATGELTADSAAQVRRTLRSAGMRPLQVRPSDSTIRRRNHSTPDEPEDGARRRQDAESTPRNRSATRTAAPRALRPGAGRAALVELYESLSALLASGLPLASALETVARTHSAARRGRAQLSTICRELAESLAQGESLAGAMSARPDSFRDIDRALVRAAEESGELERALCDLAEHHARGEELRGRLAAALSYPALLCAFGLGVVVFLSTATLPPLVSTLTDAGVRPPALSAALIGFGDALARWWWAVVIAALVGMVALRTALRGSRGAAIALRVPLLGPAMSRAELGAACVMLARLLEGGVTLGDALVHAAPTVRNASVRAGLSSLRQRLIDGGSLRGDGPEGGGVAGLPEDLVRVLEVGRESGELPRSLRTLGERRLRSARRLIDRLAAVLEPAVILVLAALIGAVVYAAIAPMLRLAQTL